MGMERFVVWPCVAVGLINILVKMDMGMGVSQKGNTFMGWEKGYPNFMFHSKKCLTLSILCDTST